MTRVLTPTKESKESSTTFTKNSINQGQKKPPKKTMVEKMLKNYIFAF